MAVQFGHPWCGDETVHLPVCKMWPWPLDRPEPFDHDGQIRHSAEHEDSQIGSRCHLIGTTIGLVLSSPWYYYLKVLPPDWYYHLTGTTISLVLPSHWYYHAIGTTISLVLSSHWYYHLIGTIISVILSSHWYYHVTGTIISLLIPSH